MEQRYGRDKSLLWIEGKNRISLENHSVGYNCLNRFCGMNDDAPRDASFYAFNAIGVVEPPFPPEEAIVTNPKKEYALVVQCPECQTIYWFHMGRDYIKDLNDVRAKLGLEMLFLFPEERVKEN